MTNTNILYVEDDENDAYLLQHAFKLAGITNPVHTASNGQEAMDYLRESGTEHPLPGLILLDIKMPSMSGLEVLGWIRQQAELRGVVIIMYTSSHNERDIERAYELGANAFTIKPSHIRDITEFARTLKAWWLERNQFAPLCEAPHIAGR